MAPATAGASVHAHAAAKKKKAKPPVVTSVRPMNVEIGQTLEIRGKYFIRGRYKNTVAFKRDGGKAVFVKAKIGTTKLLRVTVPAKLKNEFTKSGYVVRADALPHPRPRRRSSARSSPRALASRRVVALQPGTSRRRRDAAATPPVSTGRADDGDCDARRPRQLARRRRRRQRPPARSTSRTRINATRPSRKYGRGITHAHGHLQRRLGRRRRRGRLRVPVRSRPQRRRVPAAERLPAVPGQAPVRRTRCSRTPDIDYDGDTLTLCEEYTLWEYTYGDRSTAGSAELLRRRAVLDLAPRSRRAPTPAAASRRCPPRRYDKQVDFVNWAIAPTATARSDAARTASPGTTIDDAQRATAVSTSTAARGEHHSELLLPRHRRRRLAVRRRARRGRRRPHQLRRVARPHVRRVLVGLLPEREAVPRSSTPAPTSPTATPTATACATAPTTRTTTTSRT